MVIMSIYGNNVHWLYQAYREEQEEEATPEPMRLHRHGRYTRLFVSLMQLYLPGGGGEEGEDAREQEEGEGGEDDSGELLKQFLLGAPLLPHEEVTAAVQALCVQQQSKHLAVGLAVLRDLCTYRPPCRPHLLGVVLALSVDRDENVRAAAITTVKNSLYSLAPLVAEVEAFAVAQLEALARQGRKETAAAGTSTALAKHNPAAAAGAEGEEERGGAADAGDVELQEVAKQRLPLYRHVCSRKHDLLQGLAAVYSRVSSAAKAEIDRQLPLLVRSMGPRSQPLQDLLREFPALFPDPEAPAPLDFALRLVTALTDQPPVAAAPMAPRERLATDEERDEWDQELARREEESKRRELPQPLIQAVIELHTSSRDARFLACVLPILEKDDALEALPRVVEMEKEEIVATAFERTLGAAAPPLTPAGLMVALHYVELSQLSDEKTKLKRVIVATGLCFEKRLRHFYTKEVLAAVIQQMLDLPKDLPKLFMRTVIKSMSNYPDLKSFAMRVLAALIAKQVWKDSDQWKGFIMCCAEAGAAAGPVLMQLPRPQLEEVLTIKESLRNTLTSHAKTLSTVPKHVSEILEEKQEEV